MGNKVRRQTDSPLVSIESSQRFLQSYGAMTALFDVLDDLTVLNFQALSKLFYREGVAKVQYKIRLCSGEKGRFLVLSSLCYGGIGFPKPLVIFYDRCFDTCKQFEFPLDARLESDYNQCDR